MLDLLITNAIVVTADSAGTVIGRGGVAVSGGRITAVGDNAALAEMQPQARRVIDGDGLLLMPGLINTHCHAADSLFRGLVEDLQLEPWLQTVWKAEGAILNPETTRLGARLGFAELLLGGVTTVMDMFWHPNEAVRAAREVGMRVSTGGIFFDFPGVTGHTHEQRVQAAEQFFADFEGADDVIPVILPHGTYTVSPEHLREAREIADRHGGAVLDPCGRNARRAGGCGRPLWPPRHQASRIQWPARRADGAGPLRAPRRRRTRRSWRGGASAWRTIRCPI